MYTILSNHYVSDATLQKCRLCSGQLCTCEVNYLVEQANPHSGTWQKFITDLQIMLQGQIITVVITVTVQDFPASLNNQGHRSWAGGLGGGAPSPQYLITL